MKTEHEEKLKTIRTLCVLGGKTYYVLLTGEVRQPGDVFACGDRVYPELSQYIGTPQTRIEKDDFLSQSYRPL